MGFATAEAVKSELQCIVDIYELGKVYGDKINLRDITGRLVPSANELSRSHMNGDVISRTGAEHDVKLLRCINSMYWSQLIHQPAADASTI